MGKRDSANHKKARAFINAKVKARSMAHPNALPCVACGHVYRKGERRHEYDHTHDYDDPKTWSIVEAVCTKCHHERTKKREGVQPELRRPEGTFAPGVSGNPGGVSKEKRAFLERLREDDPEKVYAAFMALIELGNPPAVLRAVEYLAGKPKESVEVNATLTADISHDVKADVIQSVDRMRTIVAVLVKSGVLELTETTAPVETKEEA